MFFGRADAEALHTLRLRAFNSHESRFSARRHNNLTVVCAARDEKNIG